MGELNSLVNKFIESTIINFTESEGGDYKLANKHHNIVVKSVWQN